MNQHIQSVEARSATSDEQYKTFFKGYRSYLVRFAKQLADNYNDGNREAIHFIDGLLSMNNGLSSLIEDFKPDSNVPIGKSGKMPIRYRQTTPI
ncbi:MAG: hypothetical protein ACXW1U_14310 [Methylobacter sp.]